MEIIIWIIAITFVLSIIVGVSFIIAFTLRYLLTSRERKIKRTMTPEKIAEIDNAEFERVAENTLFLRSKSYIYKIIEEENRVRIKLMFHHIRVEKCRLCYSYDEVYMPKEVFKNANLKVGDIVTTIHNGNYQSEYRIKEIELGKNIFDTTESCDVLESTRQKIEVDGGLEYV